MGISTRTAKLIRKGNNCTPIVLVEFASFLNEEWGRLSAYGDIEILDDVNETPAIIKTYYDYFSGDFPVLANRIDLFDGGLGSINNIVLSLSNSANLISLFRSTDFEDGIEGTTVNIYVLLSVGGTDRRSNAELRFMGYVDQGGVTWDAERIRIKIIDFGNRYNIGLLNRKLTKKDYPYIEESADGKFLPIIGGAWRSHHGASFQPNDDGDLRMNLTAPALCVDTLNNQYIAAGHPTATGLQSYLPVREANPSTPNREIGAAFRYDSSTGNLCPLYNGSATFDFDEGIVTFTVPANTPTFQGFIYSRKISEGADAADDEILNPTHCIDDDMQFETGVNCRTRSKFYALGPYRLFTRFDNFDFSIDHAIVGIYLEAILVNNGANLASGSFLIRTDGKSYYENAGKDGWIAETENEGLIYRPRISGKFGTIYNENLYTFYPYPNPNNPFHPLGDGFIVRSINLADNALWGTNYDDGTMAARENYNGTWVYGYAFPPINVDSLLGRTWTPNEKITSWQTALLDLDRIANWEFGIEGNNGLEVQSFYLRIVDAYFQGGYIGRQPMRPRRTYMDVQGNEWDNPAGHFETDESKKAQAQWRDAHRRWLAEKSAILLLDNRSPVHVILDGYTANNWQAGIVVKEPVDHLAYLMQYRLGLTAGSQWDAASFAVVAARRNADVSYAFTDRWEFHYFLENQAFSHDVFVDMARQSNSILYIYQGKYYLKDGDWWDIYTSRNPVVAQFDENDILSYSFARHSAVYDSYEINYAYSSDENTYKARLFITPFDSNWYREGERPLSDVGTLNYDITGYSEASLQAMLLDVYQNWFHHTGTDISKLHTLSINAQFILDVNTARRLMIALIKKHTKARPILDFEVGVKGMELIVGDVIYASHQDWNAIDKTTYQIASIEENPVLQTYKIEAVQIGND